MTPLRLLSSLLAAALAASLIAALRLASRPEPPAPELEPRIVRARPQKLPACRTLDGAGGSDEDEALAREIAILQREISGLSSRARMLGAPLPDDRLDRVRPERVLADVQALLPPGAEIVSACEQVPCSGVVLFDPSDPDAESKASSLEAALSALYPGSASPGVYVDARGRLEDADRAEALGVFFTVSPDLEAEEHKARLYFLAHRSRSEAAERLREHLSTERP